MSRTRLLLIIALIALVALPAGLASAQPAGEGTAVVWDDEALSDAITISMDGVGAPSAGTEYVGWLISDDQTRKLSTGPMTMDFRGNIDYTFDHNSNRYTGENLIREFSIFVITEETAGADPDAPAGPPAFADALPLEAVAHIRHLLTDWPPDSGAGILTNLQTQLDVAILHADLAKNELEKSPVNTDGVKQHVEHVINAIEGSERPQLRRPER